MKHFFISLVLIGAFLLLEAANFFTDAITFYVVAAAQTALLITAIVLLFAKPLAKRLRAIAACFLVPAVIGASIPIAVALPPNNVKQAEFVIHAGGGHKGLNYLNSQEPFIAHAEAGCELIEIDFNYTSDGQIVATHAFPDMPPYSSRKRPTLQQFEAYKIQGKYTGITFAWLVETLKQYPNVKIVTDIKEGNQVNILTDMAEYCAEHDFDLFSRFIVQVYSYRDYKTIKAEPTLAFKTFWFTNYRVYYTPTQIMRCFGDCADVETIVLAAAAWWPAHQQGFRFENKNIAVHTVQSAVKVKFLAERGVDYVYIDDLATL